MTDTPAPTCARHPKIETYLRCAACNTPICPDCAVQTAVGYKCRQCGVQRAGAYSPPTLGQALATILVGLIAGVLAAWVLGSIGFWGFFIAVAYGRFVGTVLLRTSGGKIGLIVDILCAGSIVLGGLLLLGGKAWIIYQQYQALQQQHLPADALNEIGSSWISLVFSGALYQLIALGITAAAAISRMRFPWSWGI